MRIAVERALQAMLECLLHKNGEKDDGQSVDRVKTFALGAGFLIGALLMTYVLLIASVTPFPR